MTEAIVRAKSLLADLPAAPRRNLTESISDLLGKVDRKIIVLDDDPTGTQTVHEIPVITKWTVEHLVRELVDRSPVSYVLTNSRSIDAAATVALHREISKNLREASERSGRDFVLISRSDSTLRGHFWEEMSTLSQCLGQSFDAWIFCPFFEEGGRLTVGDTHYVAEGDNLVPAARTPFARDAAFGYAASNLRQWVVEKSGGKIREEMVDSLPLDELRAADARPLRARIARLHDGQVLIVNAVQRSDLESAVLALLEAESRGKRFLYRSAASLVAVRSGIAPRPPLDAGRLVDPSGRGILVVVGSYVPKTTEQLEYLRRHDDALFFELEVRKLLDSAARNKTITATAEQITAGLSNDRPVVVYTSREVVHSTADESLAIGMSISRALVEVVRAVGCRPRVLIAKGGITSSDLATEALGLERSIVLGQVLPGVPVWKCGPESRYPGMALVVFPGNVGERPSLHALVHRLI